MAGPTVKVRIDGAWVDVGGGSSGAPAGEEVVVGGAQPTDPVTELWYDEADPGADAVVPWITATMANGWVPFQAGYGDPQYRKIGDIVYLRGTVALGTIGQSAFTLPDGYRPPATLLLSTVSSDLFGQMRVFLDGQVIPQTGSNIWFSLNNVQFSVTP